MITAFFSSTEVGERAEAVPDSGEEGGVEEVLLNTFISCLGITTMNNEILAFVMYLRIISIIQTVCIKYGEAPLLYV